MRIRQATHAGSWYSQNDRTLHKQIDDWFAAAAQDLHSPDAETESRTIRAVIVPHAGFRFSGPTAAYAYQHLVDAKTIRRVFILGPSHYFYLKGCAVSSATEYETPLGNIPIDQEVNEQLANTGKFTKMTIDVDEEEHSIEMQLPFVLKALQGRSFSAVPILVGSTTGKLDAEYGRILAPYFDDPSNFFVISSDFCHWGSRFRYQPYDQAYGEIYEYIKYLDHEAIQILERLDQAGFAEYLERTSNTICGRHPISLLLHTIGAASPSCQLKCVKYAQSSECKKRSDSSVSYVAAVVHQT